MIFNESSTRLVLALLRDRVSAVLREGHSMKHVWVVVCAQLPIEISYREFSAYYDDLGSDRCDDDEPPVLH